MIVRILSRGSSFKGLATYLTHDPSAETKDRVAWTHTLNLANDHVPSGVDEMLWTARHAELLKQEAGIRAGGRETENAVKHLSLNWAPDQDPSRENMVEATEDFLQHMGWQDHQTLLVAHQDREHSHVHAMINMVHPETGLRLDDGFERRRAQAWALDYEREHGRIYCEQRLLDPGAREEAPTRPAWTAFQEKQQDFERDEKARRAQEPIIIAEPENAPLSSSDEWRMLKDLQRRERQTFFADGKAEFSELRRSVFREVREDFRERWSDFYLDQRAGVDPAALAETKAALLSEQKAVLESRRDEACDELREARDLRYRDILNGQREYRLDLRWRQDAGLDNAQFLTAVEERAAKPMPAGFQPAAAETTQPYAWERPGFDADDAVASRHESSGMRSGADIAGGIGSGLGFGLLAFFGGIGDGLVASNPGPRPRQTEPTPPRLNPFDAPAVDAHSASQREQEEADRERRQRERALYGE